MSIFVLQTVADYVYQCRVLLQDLVVPARYPDEDIISALNMAFYEIARLRPDILMDAKYQGATTMRSVYTSPTINTYDNINTDEVVSIPDPYRMPLLYFITGYVQLRDAEEMQDARASALMNKFTSQLLTVMA